MATPDFSKLFGLNNKQESMDTARIESFEPDTFKPIMAGPEVAQGVAAGLFNMGNAVFGAFDNKVKEISRDDTARSTDAFLNNLQLAANTVSPDQLPLVIRTFSDVLDNDPSILQDKARMALNELSARHSKDLESVLDAQTKLAIATAKENGNRGSNGDKVISELTKTSEQVNTQINDFPKNASGQLENYLVQTIVSAYADPNNKDFNPADVKSLLESNLVECLNSMGMYMDSELQKKILDNAYNRLFNEDNFTKAITADQEGYNENYNKYKRNQRELIQRTLPGIFSSALNGRALSPEQLDLIKQGVAVNLANSWHSLPPDRKRWIDANLGRIKAKLEDKGLVEEDLVYSMLNLLLGELNIKDKDAVDEYLKDLNNAINEAEGQKYNSEAFRQTGFHNGEEKTPDDRPVISESLGELIENTFKDKNVKDSAIPYSNTIGDLFGALLYDADFSARIQNGLRDLHSDLNKQDNDFDKYKYNSVLSYLKGNRTFDQLRTEKTRTYEIVSSGWNSLQNRKENLNRTIDQFFTLGGNSSAPSEIYSASTVPLTPTEQQAANDAISKYTSTWTKDSKRFKVIPNSDNLLAMSKEIPAMYALLNNIGRLLPNQMSVKDLIQAEAFAIGIYPDGPNVAIGLGNNIKGNKALINKIAEYEKNGDYLGIANDADFNDAIYKSVQNEAAKVSRAYQNQDPAEYYIYKKGTADFKNKFNEKTTEKQNMIRHHINTAIFLAYYRGEGDKLKKALDKPFDLITFNTVLKDFIYSGSKKEQERKERRYSRLLITK